MPARRPYPIPVFVSQPIAARLLDFFPPSNFARHLKEHRELFPGSTERLFAVADINAHPRRNGKPVSASEVIRLDNALADARAAWRSQNARRAAGTLITGRGRWQQQQPKAETETSDV
jgi:hypothetical protein